MSDIVTSGESISIMNIQNANGISFEIYAEEAVRITIDNGKAIDFKDGSVGIEGLDIEFAYRLRDFLNSALPEKENK